MSTPHSLPRRVAEPPKMRKRTAILLTPVWIVVLLAYAVVLVACRTWPYIRRALAALLLALYQPRPSVDKYLYSFCYPSHDPAPSYE